MGIGRANWPFHCAENRENTERQLCPSAHPEKRFYVLPILSACALITWKFEEGKPEKIDDVNKISYYQNKL